MALTLAMRCSLATPMMMATRSEVVMTPLPVVAGGSKVGDDIIDGQDGDDVLDGGKR